VRPTKKCNQGAVEKFRAGGEGVIEIFLPDIDRGFFYAKPDGDFCAGIYQK